MKWAGEGRTVLRWSGLQPALVLGPICQGSVCLSWGRVGHGYFPLPSPLAAVGKVEAGLLPTDIQGLGGQWRLPRGGDQDRSWR